MGEHRTPYVVPWFYWCMRFDFEGYYLERFKRRGHRPSVALRLAMLVAASGCGYRF